MNLLTRRAWLATSSLLAAEWLDMGRASAADFCKLPPAERVGSNTAIKGFGLDQAIDALQQGSFSTIEIHPFGRPEPQPGQIPGFQFDKLDPNERRRLKERLRPFAHVTAHLPFIGITVVSSDKQQQQEGRRAIEVAMDAAEYFECEVAVIHCIPPKGRSLAEAWDELVALYRSWGERAARGGYVLAVETGYPTSVASFVKFVRDIDHPNVGATIDVGHQIRYAEFRKRFPQGPPDNDAARRAYNDVIEMLVDQLGRKLVHFHVHDIDPTVWRDHRPIGSGVVDYPRLFGRLKQAGYEGLFVLEVEGTGDELVRHLRDNRKRLIGWLQAACREARR